MHDVTRRHFLGRGTRALGAFGLALASGGAGAPARAAMCGADAFGALQPPDSNGLMLPPGFGSRVVATSGVVVPGTAYAWHANPDGGATFAAPRGNWVYVSNSESPNGQGGVGVVRFNAVGAIVDAYSILSGTNRNCAGGPTPWGTWLSCEEVAAGRVWECDPLAPGSQGSLRAALGTFQHEAAAVDPIRRHVFMTEDRPDSLLYRFTPDSYPDLGTGSLYAAEILDPRSEGAIAPGQVRPLAWHAVPDPNPASGGTETRHQVADATPFSGGEGCWYESAQTWFTTKHDNRVWRIDNANDTIEILYDAATSPTPLLTGADNVYASPCGDVYVAEDPGDLQIVAFTPSGAIKPIMQLTGVSGTEITGPALSPDGRHLYFSSQRNPGTTFEVTGPFVPNAAVLPSMNGVGTALAAFALALAGTRRMRNDRAAVAPEDRERFRRSPPG